jgi:hypothetical protein
MQAKNSNVTFSKFENDLAGRVVDFYERLIVVIFAAFRNIILLFSLLKTCTRERECVCVCVCVCFVRACVCTLAISSSSSVVVFVLQRLVHFASSKIATHSLSLSPCPTALAAAAVISREISDVRQTIIANQCPV